jgi:hypothetical protein
MQDLRRLTVAILCALLTILQDVRGEIVSIATWNLEWFPGGKPNSSQAKRLVHMSAAKDALLDIRPDILCLQEVRDWESVAELISILPNFQTLVVSRFREMGSSGPLSIQQLAIASNRPAESAWSEPFKPSPDGLAKRLSGHVDASVKKLTTPNAPGGNKYVLSNTPSTRGRQVFLERSMGA